MFPDWRQSRCGIAGGDIESRGVAARTVYASLQVLPTAIRWTKMQCDEYLMSSFHLKSMGLICGCISGDSIYNN